ncbi:unnamed protein product [marine sediment metagenome]|uniref:Uncharacterized protein n=1 Tax=marine sediment metagenome TaxID=412755 RepID=X1KQU9_9ZZZZ
MVRKVKKVDRRGSEVYLVRNGDKAGLTCIGEVCWNPVTDVIEIELQGDCDPDILRNVVNKVMDGKKVEFIMPPVKKHEVKEQD